MYFFIIFFLPSVFGLKLFMNFNKENKKMDLLIYYFLFVLFSNLGVLTIMIIFNKGINNLLDYAMTNFIFCVKYMYMSLFVNFILSIVFSIIIKYFTFTVGIEYEGKKTSKKTKKIKNI